MDSDDNITLETLLPLREFMNTSQLERFGDYLANREPSAPFTQREVSELQYIRIAILDKLREFDDLILRDKNNDKEKQ